MGKFAFIETPIPDMLVIEPTVYSDGRGYFMETYNPELDAVAKHIDGAPARFVQDNESRSQKGVLRGLHMQRTRPQGKLVRVTRGAAFDAGVDLRPGSKTFGKWYGLILTEENKRMFYIPEGFAHGFLALSDDVVFTYKCTNLYDKADEVGILWNDAQIGVRWPLDGRAPLLSEKDARNPTLKQFQMKYAEGGACETNY